MNKAILRLAIPSIITNVTVPLLSSVDTALMGHLEGQYYVGGVAIGAMIFNVIFWGSGFLRMGTTGLTAQAYGKADDREGILTLARAILVAIGIGLMLLIAQELVAWIAFKLVHASGEVKEQASLYYHIRIWSAPAVLMLYAIQGWFLGMQNARYPMILAIFVNLVTVSLDVTFLKVFKMKTEGVAIGSVIANYLGLGLAVILFLISYRSQLAKIVRTEILEMEALKRFFNINRDIFLRTILLIIAYAFFTAKSAEDGDTLLAANSILLQLWLILSYGIDGFAYAAESLVGRFIGAKDSLNLRKAVNYLFYWGAAMSAIMTLIYFLFGESIVRLFTDKEEVVAAAMAFFIWTIFAPIINAACFIWDGVYIGATKTKAMLYSMLISTAVFYLPVYYLAWPAMGNHALWLAFSVFMVVRGLTLTLFAKKQVFTTVA